MNRAKRNMLIFASVLAAGFFCMWIGGVKPFTPECGIITFGIFVIAAYGTTYP